MKKVYSFLPLLLSSFFLFFISDVKATTYNYTIPESVITFTGSNISTMINTVNTFIENDSEYLDKYFISSNSNTSGISVYIQKRNGYPSADYLSSWGFVLRTDATFYRFTFSSDYSSLSSGTRDGSNFLTGLCSSFYVLYSNFDIGLSNNGNIYNYSFLDTSFQDVSNGENKFTTVYDMYESYYGEPEPVDPTPELTSFYTTVVDKISYLCSYMATNTLFLAMFVIIIFIVIIELIFRRRL